MKPKTIGIVGGAGPMAGASLLDRVICLSISKYSCSKDADFPKVLLISFPFSEMLTPEMDPFQLKNELRESLNQLRDNGAAVLAIACNTLHAFLSEKDDLSDLVHLPRVVATEIPEAEIPLVLCTSTSKRFALHKQFFPCTYPDEHTQIQVDEIIDQILKGSEEQALIEKLQKVLQKLPAKTIVLGCTELSLFTKQLMPCGKTIIDPLEIAAKKLVEKSFKK